MHLSPLQVSEQCVRLQPGSDVRVNRKAVLGTGSLKLPNLRENLKLLQERAINTDEKLSVKSKQKLQK